MILGISASLRNARYGVGSEKLVDEIAQITDRDALGVYLEQQTKIRLDDYISAGRAQGIPFDETFKNIKKMRHDRGLSNSEASLVAGLWGAVQEGAEICHLGLSQYFHLQSDAKSTDELREAVLQADAILVSGPVYFGDRGSLTHDFLEFIRNDEICSKHLKDKVFAGIAVGAKRNGGQETTLIYQIIDATNLNMLAVGNDSNTTAQYGGTSVAGDVGTLQDDDYGIKTSIGTGRRIARVGKILADGENQQVVLKDKANIQIWLLQDEANKRGNRLFTDLSNKMMSDNPSINVTIHDFTEEDIHRCIACDVCPIDVGPKEEYRCIINSKKDAFVRHHETIISADAILLAAYSPIVRSSSHCVYQKFIERTRYLRRDDYVLGDRLAAPLVISQLNSNQNLHIRMLTSIVRHHTVLHHPLIGFEQDNDIMNWDFLVKQASSFANKAVQLTKGRLMQDTSFIETQVYNPVGYEVSAAKAETDKASGRIDKVIERRKNSQNDQRETRISSK